MEPVDSIELQPVLHGETLWLRPMQAEDFAALYQVASDPLIWEVHPEPTRYQRPAFEKFFAKGIGSKGALVVIDKATQRIMGTSRYYDWNPSRREIAIGYTFLARQYWGGAANGEMKRLMLDHIFQWAPLVWFHIGAANWRSRKALEKLGGSVSHFAPMDVNGVPTDYAYYTLSPSMLR
ncbi:MAG TPA: GNAT family N-acetyltransferase [Candidatus Acidoferrum sp.]|nr:GNAT family N-acetyltransferase [Candidatus Acidoferrum sp.]